MRYWLLILILASACSPFKRAQKHWGKLQEEIRKNPELVDTFKIVKRDTIKTSSVRDSIVYRAKIDTAKVDSLARLLLEAQNRKPEIIKEIAQAVCPKVSRDTTLYLEVRNSNLKFFVPLRLKVVAKGSELRIDFSAEPVTIPDPEVTTKVEFKEAPKSHWRNIWFWVAVGLFIVLVGVIFKK